MSRTGNSTETGSGGVVYLGVECSRAGGWQLRDLECLVKVINGLKLIMAKVLHICEFTKKKSTLNCTNG